MFVSDNEKKKAKKFKFRDRADEHKFLELVAYQFELIYDLATNPHDNVSTNPGFESCLGVW